MAVNVKQKIDKVNINSDLQTYLETKFSNGWVINQMISLVPIENKILCVFVKMDDIV